MGGSLLKFEDAMSTPANDPDTFESYKNKIEESKSTHRMLADLSDAQNEGVDILDPRLRAMAAITGAEELLGITSEDRPQNVHPTNCMRAELAREALYYYAYIEREDPFIAADLSSLGYDFLCDLMHLCHQEGVNIKELFSAVYNDRFVRELADPDYEKSDEELT